MYHSNSMGMTNASNFFVGGTIVKCSVTFSKRIEFALFLLADVYYFSQSSKTCKHLHCCHLCHHVHIPQHCHLPVSIKKLTNKSKYIASNEIRVPSVLKIKKNA
jgi:hypothetical protein